MPRQSTNWPWRAVLTYIAINVKSILIGVEKCTTKIDDLRNEVARMGEKVTAAEARLEADIQAVADMVAAKDALIASLTADRDAARAALATADADKAAAVAAQASSDDDADSAVIDAGDAALQNLLHPAPADGGDSGSGDGSAPVDGGDAGSGDGGEAPVDGGDAPVDGGSGDEAPVSE